MTTDIQTLTAQLIASKQMYTDTSNGLYQTRTEMNILNLQLLEANQKIEALNAEINALKNPDNK